MSRGTLAPMLETTHPDVAALAARAEELSAQELVTAILERFGDRVSLACSFQKEETVLLDMLFGIEPKARVFAIDTHYLFPETYEHWREVEQRYDTKIEMFEGPSRRGADGDARRAACGSAAARPLPRGREGRAAGSRARSARLLDHRRPPRPGADARERAEARLGRRARAVEGEPARRLVRRRLLGVHPGARAPLQRPARPRLRIHRRHSLDAPGRRPRRPLGRQRPDRVRTASE